MARISIYYDKEEKEQFFMLRGDEAYTRSTKTYLEMGTPSLGKFSFDVDVTVNVLRDIGEGIIVIYDNDEPVATINDWSHDKTGETVTLESLNYDITHNFYARYMGNNQCSGSKSASIELFLENTNRYIATLTIDDSVLQYDPHSQIVDLPIVLSNDGDPIYNHGQRITVYYDDVQLPIPYFTPNDGDTVYIDIDDVGDSGLHTIKAVYAGSNNLNAVTVSQNISVGYNVTATKYPQVHVYRDTTHNNIFAVSVADFFGNPAGVGSTVTMKCGSSTVGTGTISSDGSWQTEINGHLPYAQSQVATAHFETGINEISYQSADFNFFAIPSVSSSRWNVSANGEFFSKGNSTILTFKDNTYSISNIPVAINGTVYKTDANGKIDYEVIGTGVGSKRFVFDYGHDSKVIELADWIQYWSPPSTLVNRNYSLYYGNLIDYNTLFKILTPTAYTFFGLPNIDDDIDYELILSNLTTAKNTYIAFIKDWGGDINNIEIGSDIIAQRTFTAHKNEKWSVVRENGTVSVLKNDVEIKSYSDQDSAKPLFWISCETNNVECDFIKLTIQGIE